MYLFTEMVGVPEIGLVMLKNYLKYHSDVIHIYCTEEDKKCMSSEIDSDLVKTELVAQSFGKILAESEICNSRCSRY